LHTKKEKVDFASSKKCVKLQSIIIDSLT
jgi:hypothetical protein